MKNINCEGFWLKATHSLSSMFNEGSLWLYHGLQSVFMQIKIKFEITCITSAECMKEAHVKSQIAVIVYKNSMHKFCGDMFFLCHFSYHILLKMIIYIEDKVTCLYSIWVLQPGWIDFCIKVVIKHACIANFTVETDLKKYNHKQLCKNAF